MQIPAAKQYEKPAAGPHYGVLIDVVDLGVIAFSYQGQTKMNPGIRFIWQLATVGQDGKPLQVWSPKLNASSWHEKGGLYKTVKMIIGTPPTPALDPESLIGQVRQLFISRDKSADGTKDFANIVGIAPAPGITLPVPADYVRMKFRQPANTQQQQNPAPQAQPTTQSQFNQYGTPAGTPAGIPPQGTVVKF